MKTMNLNERPVITPAMERAVAKAYEEFDGGDAIRVPQREHLGVSRRKGVCCDHVWRPVEPSAENMKYLQELFEEKELSGPAFCKSCGAVALVDNLPDRTQTPVLTTWAYDGTAKFFGRPRKEKPHDQNKREERRPRR